MRVRVSAVFEREGEILCMKYIYGGKDVFALPGGGVDQDTPLREAISSGASWLSGPFSAKRRTICWKWT